MSSNQKHQSFKIALYIRVSTEEQAENPEGSIKSQEQRLREAVAYRNRNGSFGTIQGVYIDPGISAKDMRRPKLQELLRAVRGGEVNLIMVTELSRLSRNTRDFIQMWDMMRAHGCRFQSLREDFDTTNAAGELLLFQLMNLAQFERRQTSERVGANMQARAARGLYSGGLVPVGYRTVADKPGYLEVDEEMATVVRAAFAAFSREGSLAGAALWLNDNGYRLSKKTQGGGRRARLGHFTFDNLQRILRNKAYLGIKTYRSGGETKEARAVWPAIIGEAEFQRAGKLLDRNRRRLKPWKEGRMPFILTGTVHCQKCASHMPGKSATGKFERFGYYEHAWATKRDATLSKKIFRCEPHRVPSKKLEPLVMEKLRLFLTDAAFMRDLLARVRKHHEVDPTRKEKERLKAKVCGVASQLDALAERIGELPKTVSAEPLYRQMEKLEAIKKEHEEALLALAMEGGSLDRVVGLDTFQSFASHYRAFVTTGAGVPEQKQMVQKFIRKVEVGVDSVRIHFIVDKDHYQRELASKEAGSRPQRGAGFLTDGCSNTLTTGAPGEIRTPDQLVRSQLLYPTELRARKVNFCQRGPRMSSLRGNGRENISVISPFRTIRLRSRRLGA